MIEDYITDLYDALAMAPNDQARRIIQDRIDAYTASRVNVTEFVDDSQTRAITTP